MKKLILSLFIALGVSPIYCQHKDHISTEIDADYYYYFLGENNTNSFNFGFSVLISKYISKIKISSGMNYSTKYYHNQNSIFISIKKYNYKIAYLNFPIILNHEIISKKSFGTSLSTGFSFNKIIDYDIELHYLNNEIQILNDIDDNQQLGLTFLLGVTLSKSISNSFKFNLSPIVNFKLVPDHRQQRPYFTNLPDDNVSIELKFGIEYSFKRRDNK